MDPQPSPSPQPSPAPVPEPVSPSPQAPVPSQPTPDAMSGQAPAPAPAPIASEPAPVAPVSPVPPAKGKNGKLGLIVGVFGVIVVVLLGIAVLFALPSLQANNASNSFMHDITTGNVSAATDLTDGGSSNTAFLQTAAKSVSGGFSLKSNVMQNSMHYYLYTLTNSTNKYARTILKKESGGWKVTSFVFSPTSLALVPGKVSSSSISGTTAPSTATDASACLTADDFSYFSNVESSPTQFPNGLYEGIFQLQFSPNVATYDPAGATDPTTVFNDFKNFYAVDSGKNFQVELEGSVNSASPDDSLATARNDQVQSDLETQSGIPASKIIIQPLTNDTSDNSAGDSFYRQVQITLTSGNSCATS